jgi:hypothetical protein
MIGKKLLTSVLALSLLALSAASIPAVAQTADSNAPSSLPGDLVYNLGWNSVTSSWDRIRTGGSTDNSGTTPNTGIVKNQMFIYNSSAGNLVPLSSANANLDANALGNGPPAGIYGWNGASWDRLRQGVSNNTLGTGVLRVQPETGYSSTLNMTAATQVKATAGRAYKISVVTAGAVGQLCDTTTVCAAANVVMTVPAAVGVYEINWPFATGIRYEPGAAQVSAISWN